MHFVNGDNFRPDSPATVRFADKLSTDVNSNAVRNEQNVVNNAAKSAAEWQRILLMESICDRASCSVVLDLSQCEKSHYFESSVSGKTIKVREKFY